MQTEMNFEDNEPEISIKAMLFFALHRWKSILLAGIILAVIFGACRLWSANRTAQALEEAINSGAVVLSGFEKEYQTAADDLKARETELLTQSKRSTDLQKQINDAKKKIADDEIGIAYNFSSLLHAYADERKRYNSRKGLVYKVSFDDAVPTALRFLIVRMSNDTIKALMTRHLTEIRENAHNPRKVRSQTANPLGNRA